MYSTIKEPNIERQPGWSDEKYLFESRKECAERTQHADDIYLLGEAYEKGIGTEINYSKAEDLFIQSAQLGWTDAMYELYVMFSDGHTRKTSNDDKNTWLEKAAEYGMAIAQTIYAKEIIEGRVPGKTPQEAFERLQIATKRNETNAACLLGQMYCDGIGTEKDVEKGIEILLSSCANPGLGTADEVQANGISIVLARCENGDSDFDFFKPALTGGYEVLYNLISSWENQHQKTKYRDTLSKASSGDVCAMKDLSAMIAFGEGCDVNILEAFNWAKKAADLNDSEANYYLAQYYNNEVLNVVPNDFAEFMRRIEKSAALGYGEAKVQLGIYWWNNGFTLRAFDILFQGAKEGIEGCQNTLAFYLHLNELSLPLSLHLYHKSAPYNEKAEGGLRIMARNGYDIVNLPNDTILKQEETEVIEALAYLVFEGNSYKISPDSFINSRQEQDEAIEFVNRYANIGYNVHNILGYFYRVIGKFDQALETHQQALNTDPDKGTSLFGIAESYKGMGDTDKYISTIQKSIDAGNIAAMQSYGCYLLDTNQADKIVKGLELLKVAANNNSEDAIEVLLKYYNQVDIDYKEQLRWAEKGMENENAMTTLHLSYLYWKGLGVEKNLFKAKEYCKKAIELSPANHPKMPMMQSTLESIENELYGKKGLGGCMSVFVILIVSSIFIYHII